MSTRTYANQFGPDYAPPAELLAALAAGGWVDESWGNDTSPKWVRGFELLWCDHSDPAGREFPRPRFSVTHGDECLIAGTTDDVREACRWAAWHKPYHVDYRSPCCPDVVNVDARAEVLHRFKCPKWRADLVAGIKREILDDIRDGTQPATVASYSELHDHVDANGYGGAFELLDEIPGESIDEKSHEALIDALNFAQSEVDAWLAAGNHRAELAARHPGIVFDDDCGKSIGVRCCAFAFDTADHATAHEQRCEKFKAGMTVPLPSEVGGE